MEHPLVRIGWLRMLLRVLQGTPPGSRMGGSSTYEELIRDVQEQIRLAEEELRGSPEGRDVRQRP
jgi:hypothetical protein